MLLVISAQLCSFLASSSVAISGSCFYDIAAFFLDNMSLILPALKLNDRIFFAWTNIHSWRASLLISLNRGNSNIWITYFLTTPNSTPLSFLTLIPTLKQQNSPDSSPSTYKHPLPLALQTFTSHQTSKITSTLLTSPTHFPCTNPPSIPKPLYLPGNLILSANAKPYARLISS
ncbi:uncharacterized protein EAE97_004616 [Botrytis byssoidea]|uniref:Uncharacterized protein n=1 Tax=Botrytis byssoidea TaxID=139641 RepID=A0A9P5IQQ6_9HELO|nr:uncharacterized protein EAE97_004616 [Botrytis byssoidea]KAF7947367.1 hypothetical protein EAE97_004616 [Botrytis byssoidea]